MVKKGQVLFIIDPVQFEEAVKVAEANVNVAKAAVATAQLTADNKRELARKNIISEYDLQMAENTLASQKAALAQAEAQLTNAKNNLSYTQVTRPPAEPAYAPHSKIRTRYCAAADRATS